MVFSNHGFGSGSGLSDGPSDAEICDFIMSDIL